MNDFFKKIKVGLTRNPKLWILSCFLSYAALWTLFEPFVSFISPNLSGIWKFVVFISSAILLGTLRIIPKDKIVFKLSNTNTKISIEFNDMFTISGEKVIAVNEFFDSEIGEPVSPNSLHGYFLQKILGGHIAPYDDEVNKLIGKIPSDTVDRDKGKKIKFPIGTTIEIKHSTSKYFLFALCKTDENYKAYSNPSMMLEALNGLWRFVRNKHNGEKIVVPLIGSKLGGVGLPPKQLLDLLIISILKATKEQELSTDIIICLMPEIFDEVNLNDVMKQWS